MSGYVLISPCRNESDYMRRTLDSVLAQTAPPSLWVIVDDGSTDDTPQILAEYAAQHSEIRVVTRSDRGFRRVGGGVVDAFNDGLAQIDVEDYAFLCKLDLDLELPRTYFEFLISEMEQNPRLGTCSGKPFYRLDGHEFDERVDDENSVGMTKFYRTDCFREIGGFEPEVMWDGIDCHRCRMLGWHARAYRDDAVRFEHLRPMGSSHKNILVGRARHGRGQYYMGTHPLYITASIVNRISDRPALAGSLAMAFGYLRAAIAERKRYPDKRFRKFVQRFQLDCLKSGKSQAVKALSDRTEREWRLRHHLDLASPGESLRSQRV